MASNSPLKSIVKDLLPPMLLRTLPSRGGLGFHGDYPSWESAQADCAGYDQPSILEKVSASTQAVVDGRAVFERDSVLFDKPDYNWPLLAILQKVARQDENRLRLIDFGGSLGSTYRQCRRFLEGLEKVEWNVVEQQAFISRGRADDTDSAQCCRVLGWRVYKVPCPSVILNTNPGGSDDQDDPHRPKAR